MGQVTIEVNGRPYIVGCADGQEAHLQQIGRLFDNQVRQVAQEVGQLGDTRLMLMGALLVADDLANVRNRLKAAEARATEAVARVDRLEAEAAAALNAAAARIEALAGEPQET